MATNTLRPNDSPRRANVPREVSAPEPVVAPVAEEEAGPPVAARPTKSEEAAPRAKAERARSSWSIFSLLDRLTSVDGLFREGLPVRFLPHLLFVMALTLLYIGNTHYGNRMNRSIQRLKQETEDLRADYTTLKSDYMEASKQSEVARKVAAFGLVESSSPPFRITVPAGHLDAAELELMPVLTADTLAARAARDSAAAHLADSLAGRRRSNSSTDSGPEIIAPPQALDGDTSGSAVANALRTASKPTRARKAGASQAKPTGKAAKGSKPAVKKPTTRTGKKNKPDGKHPAQKGTSRHKEKESVSQSSKPARR
jgi:hypothetical protein